MAKKYKIEIEGDTSSVNRSVDELSKGLDAVKAKAGIATTALDEVSKGAPKAEAGFKKMGLALKAAFAATGLGVIAAIFEMFKSSQPILDIFNTAMTASKMVFTDIMDLIKPLTDALGKLFTDPVAGIKELGKMIKDYVINYFNQAWDIIKNVGGALANLVTGDWKALKDNLKEIATSVGDAILGSEGATQKLVENVKVAIVEADKLTKLLNKIQIAEAQIEKSRAINETQMVRLRQVRDDEQRSIQDRIKANEDLGKLIEAQIVQELAVAKMKTEAARMEAQKSTLLEKQADIIRAEAAEAEILNRLEGTRSEMLMNVNALLREQRDIQKGIQETEKTLQDLRDEQAKVEMASALDKLNFELEAIDRKRQAEIQALDATLSTLTAGTAAYQEQLNIRAIAEEQYNLDKLTKQQEIFDEEVRIAQETADAKKEADKQVAEYKKKIAEEEKKDRETIAAAQISTAESVLGAVGEIAGENAGVQKGISIAEATINTYKGATMALGSSPPPYNFIMMAAVIAAGIASIVKIAKTKIPKSKGGEGSVPSASGISTAASGGVAPGGFSMVQPLSNSFQMSQSTTPVKAYVVNSEIESAAELDRSIKVNARG